MTNLLFLCLQRQGEMSESCKIILAGKIKMLKNTETCMHKRVHTQEYIFLHPHTHNFKHKHNWIFFSYSTFTLKLTCLWRIFLWGSTVLCSVFRLSCIASGRKFLPPVCFFFSSLSFCWRHYYIFKRARKLQGKQWTASMSVLCFLTLQFCSFCKVYKPSADWTISES